MAKDRMRTMTIGIAAGEQGLVATLRLAGRTVCEAVPVPDVSAGADATLNGDTAAIATASAADRSAALFAAMAQLRERLDSVAGRSTAGARVHVALLPPLAEARLLALPPMRDREAAAVVSRDAARHFLAVPAPRATAVAPRRQPAAPVLAVAAGTALMDVISTAITHAGWRVAGFCSAHAAWTAAATRRGIEAVVAVHGPAAHVIVLDAGAPAALRRMPGQALDECVAAAGQQPGAVRIFAAPADHAALAARFAAAGWSVEPRQHDAAATAALNADASQAKLVTAGADSARRGVEQRLAVRLAAAAVMLLIGAAAVELWGEHRELDAVRERRAEIRGEVEPLLARRDSIEHLLATTGEVDAAAQHAHRWTAALYDIAMLLPEESYLTRLYSVGDTITIEAEGARAGAALQALRAARSLRDARLVGVVDRELADGATAVERFRISARLSR
jgi:hypothetical protein